VHVLPEVRARLAREPVPGAVARRIGHGDKLPCGVTPVASEALELARERALGFVLARGDELGRRRSRALAGRTGAEPVGEWLARLQLPDGGFRSEAADCGPSSLAATRRALGALADLGALGGALVERAAGSLARAQRVDGSWAPEGDGSEPAVLEATGRVAGILARTPCVRARSLDAAAEWLAARFAPERVQGFAYGPLAAYAATFASVLHEASDAILQWCGRELERGFRTGAFDAVRTARVLLDCGAPSLPGARISSRDVLAALLREQAPDGGWLRADGPEALRVAGTLDALAALARFGLADPEGRDLLGLTT
jgi:hypothetical protein